MPKTWVIKAKFKEDKFFDIFFPDNVNVANFYVYVLFRESEIVYIGSTKNYKIRIKAHKSDGKLFDRGIIISCDCKFDALFLEKDMIFCLMPKYHFPTIRTKVTKERVNEWREKNKKRWDYFLENKNKPSEETDMYITNNSIIILHKDLIDASDVYKYVRLEKIKT